MSKLTWVIVIFLAWWIIHDPSQAGAAIQKVAGLAVQAANSVATILGSL